MERASRIATTLARLESLLAEGRGSGEIARLGDPPFLDFLFQIEVRRQVRLGPEVATGCGLTPAGLLAAARRASADGVVPVSTPVELERLLGELARRVRESGAWRPDRPLWWRDQETPSPPSSDAEIELEAIYESLDALFDDPGRLPGAESLAAAFGDNATRRWLLVPGLLPVNFCAALHHDLEAGFATGDLALAAGAVGAGRLSTGRADAVTYLTGHEADLLDRQPRLAVLAQWGLSRLLPHLAQHLPGRATHPPVTAMLARYPGPSGGYRPHLDNPGGSDDNGRELAVLLYLNPVDRPCVGGELAVWATGRSPTAPADAKLTPGAGSMALVDARTVAHQVRPLGDGPARWSLALWLNRGPQHDFRPPPPPDLSLSEVLLPVGSPPLPRDTVLWHEIEDEPTGVVSVHHAGSERPRVGIVATVYGAGESLERWCRHHLALGFDHLVLVFDRLEEAAEAATAKRLRTSHSPCRLAIWSGSEVARNRWPEPASKGQQALLDAARGGSLPQAVAARQSLNATAVLAAARTSELGGGPLEWLLHLDADELLYLEGDARGGSDLKAHFAILSEEGVSLVRYLDHEVLLPPGAIPPGADGRARFKRNPQLAVARLGPVGWERLAAALRMRPADPRPYFSGYLNGKSAVRVADGVTAAGVHGWHVAEGEKSLCLAGPSVLHFHFASADGYCRKYMTMAADEIRRDNDLFEPCRTEIEGLELARSLRRAGAPAEVACDRLLELRDRLSGFAPAEVELLEEADLLFTPTLESGLAVDGLSPGGRVASPGRWSLKP